MRDHAPPTPPELAVLALRYAADDLPADEAAAFERRLADDQPARDALAEAIRLSASAVGQPPPRPSARARAGVRERLFPTWLTRLFPRRSYRGHPAAWAGLGGAVVAAAALTLSADDPPPGPVPPPPVARSGAPELLAPPLPSPDAGAQAAAPVEALAPVPMPMPVVPGPRADRIVDPPQPTEAVGGERTNG